MFYPRTVTLPVVLVILSTLVAPSFQSPLTMATPACCDVLVVTADKSIGLVFFRSLLVSCPIETYHGNSGINCSAGGIDCGFSGQITAVCEHINFVGLFLFFMRQFFWMGYSLRKSASNASLPTPSGRRRNSWKNYLYDHMVSVASLHPRFQQINNCIFVWHLACLLSTIQGSETKKLN